MPGTILLAGGAEFGGTMAAPDRRAIELAGGVDAQLRVIPTAAAPDRNHERAGRNAVRWFRSLGAQDVAAVPLIDAASAADPAVVAALRSARLIYLLGGFPDYLGDTLAGSAAWAACRAAYADGAVLAGSSAGAMVLCERYYDPRSRTVRAGLGLLPGLCVLPHHNGFGASWAPQLQALLPALTLLGIDEGTTVISEADGWRVYGGGGATVYRDGAITRWASGAWLRLGPSA